MTRSRRTARTNGTRFETAMAGYLRWALDDRRIQRLRLHGAKDLGDIGNVFFFGEPVTIECKWTSAPNIGPHMREADREAGNQDSPYPWVLQKAAGVGLSTIRRQGMQLAYTYTDVLEQMLGHVDIRTIDRVTEGSQAVGRNKDVTMITVHQFALLCNYGQPLGPDADGGES
ncbi:hypothetical protein DSM100688_0413 [Bifidobacterium ramosum]|uniref:Uncharacterized protein n=1 Tax=Bifidobacterium ramosum TaxID=1798158 RepID=A0A6L4X447_9BIFI|nr:hypothetical protein [Bifidobacterium ramosum]KAB8289333.1 hypothetical protein DSM100688_0413 [Bifidobacterium ramosum]NEG71032.1 hypothetical protein [Bifidobacterium ramosum]